MSVQVDRIYIGPDAAEFIEISTPSSAAAYFQDALDMHVPAPGGFEIYVTPSSSRYVFDTAVTIDVPNVTIHFSPGAELHLESATAANLFLIRAPGFRCTGARVVHSVVSGNSVADRSLFRVDDSGFPGSTDGAVFEDCVFHVDQMLDPVQSFSCIRSVGASATARRRGLEVRGCTFFLSAEGVQQSVAWTGPEPHGICAIRASDTRSLVLSRNLFRGIDVARGSRCGPMVYLNGCEDALVAASAFRNLDATSLDPDPPPAREGTLIRVAAGEDPQGTPLVLVANCFENIAARFVVELLGAGGELVAFGNFGRILDSDAAVRVDASPAGSRGRGVALVGNNFHNVKRVDREMVSLAGIGDALLSGNVFLLFDEQEEPFAFEQGTCENVHVAPGQTWGHG